MLTDKKSIDLSKFLSLILRHQPEIIGIALDENGWVSVQGLLDGLNAHGRAVTLANLRHVVATNNKQRFAFSEDGSRIRASQGHSVDVDPGYQPSVPPPVLYHGTAEKSVDAILQTGLSKGSRRHVHLSTEKETAVNVGRRHGKPVVLEVAAERMHGDGHSFYISANGVWLTDAVPADYLRLLA